MNPFTKAADFLLERGWTQGQMVEHANGKVCALAAFLYANPELQGLHRDRAGQWLGRFLLARIEELAAVCRQSGALGVLQPDFGNLIPFWNDRIAKSRDEVVAMFRAAAEAWDLENAARDQRDELDRHPPLKFIPNWVSLTYVSPLPTELLLAPVDKVLAGVS